jgi:FixJ family two-component response regulator
LADCLLVDVQLGGMSGFDLLGLLGPPGAAPPVVLISGHTEESIPVRAADAGCAFVRKSDPGEALLGAIRAAVANAALPHEAGAPAAGMPHFPR